MSALGFVSGATVAELTYVAAAVLFVLGLKRLSKVKSARSGNHLAALGMALAIAATLGLLWGEVAWWVIVGGVALGGCAGLVLALRVPMTAMPEMVALLNGLGGAASLCVALAEVLHYAEVTIEVESPLSAAVIGTHGTAIGGPTYALAIVLSVLIGAVTFSGSMIAWAKLSGGLQRSTFGPLGKQGLNALLAAFALGLCAWGGFIAVDSLAIELAHLALTVVALVLGVGLVIAIGGADMPVVISLLNSYSGMAAMTTGFVLSNNLLIVAGSLVGASGIILTQIMCKAMNRSLANVLFGGFGEQAAVAGKDEGYTKVKSSSAEEVAPILESARSLIVVPGYGLAVAQAQHKVRELAALLGAKGCDVRYAIHPVAGRMPGHMNILLAEADVPYSQLYELERINGEFKNTDVVLVLGANDVCNPAANVPGSPIHGMPVLEVWDARTVLVVKRSLGSGYAGIKNELFQMDNSLMLFGDAKKVLEDLIAEVKAL